MAETIDKNAEVEGAKVDKTGAKTADAKGSEKPNEQKRSKKNKAPKEEKKEDVKKKVEWAFIEHKNYGELKVTADSRKAKNEKRFNEERFTFIVIRYKDNKTHREILAVRSLLDGKDNGSIETTISNLYNDIKQFKDFGVVMENPYFHRLCKEIEKNYSDIPFGSSGVKSSDDRFIALIDEVAQYFVDNPKARDEKKGLYFIPVTQFNTIVDVCGYHGYEMSQLRDKLVEDDFVYSRPGMFAIPKHIEGTTDKSMKGSND